MTTNTTNLRAICQCGATLGEHRDSDNACPNVWGSYSNLFKFYPARRKA
jgi:hypothetical protein